MKALATSGGSLSLRLKACASSHLADDNDESFADVLDILDCMSTTDDKSYQCRDYLRRRSARKKKVQGPSSTLLKSNRMDDQEVVDATCRWKMCEWSYRVCDHYDADREIVALAFSFLDRFLDRCSCDRNAFKLAAMTCLSMAAKLMTNNSEQHITISSLADLAQGEYETENLMEMETIILKTLDWKLNPPTVLAFVSRFHSLLPYDDPVLTTAVYQRANFFAELVVYDYQFVTEHRHLLAAACVLNAMEGLLDSHSNSSRLEAEFLENVQSSLSSVKVLPAQLHVVRERLWYLYFCSAQVEHDAGLPNYLLMKKESWCHSNSSADFKTVESASLSHSPVSVAGHVDDEREL
jgi:hypothetical protein